MKANVKPVSLETITVRGVELPFNGFNERHLRKWQDVGAEVEAKYPHAMDLSADPADLANFTDMDSIADKWEQGTKAFCELYDGVFGDGTSKKLFGDEPYYGLCLEVYYEMLGAIQQQGAAYGHKVSKTLTQFAPAGPKGAKQPVN